MIGRCWCLEGCRSCVERERIGLVLRGERWREEGRGAYVRMWKGAGFVNGLREESCISAVLSSLDRLL